MKNTKKKKTRLLKHSWVRSTASGFGTAQFFEQINRYSNKTSSNVISLIMELRNFC